MTDARFPERWLNDRRYMTLAPEQFRAFVLTMTWSVANKTNGVVTPIDLELMPWLGNGMVDLLVKRTVLSVHPDGWFIDEFLTTQTTRQQLEAAKHARELTKLRVRNHRDKHADETDVTRYVTEDVTHDSTRTGQDRPGQDEVPPRFEVSATSSSLIPSSPAPLQFRCQVCEKDSTFSLVPKDGLMVCRKCSAAGVRRSA